MLAVCALTISAACERIVDIENPVPTEVRYCEMDPGLEGLWQSDSVWIGTSTDSTDTVHLNRRPAVYYTCLMACDEDTSFRLWSINFSGVKTLQHAASNFTAIEPFVKLYDPFDEDRDSASFVMLMQRDTDSTLHWSFSNRLNDGQVTYTDIWMKKQEE